MNLPKLEKLQKLQQLRFEAFKSQDHELGDFDVVFDIGGKTIYANKNMLRPVSTTFSSMLSQRWTSKDEPIKFETYCYDDFYEFITFIYSGECQLTNANIFAMTDIAEFYQVAVFKDYCDEYLSKLECTLENVVQFLDIAVKYSLDKFKKSLVPCVKTAFPTLFKSDQYLQMSKDVLLEMFIMNNTMVESHEIFEKLYEWADNQAQTKAECNPNLNVDETTKEILGDFMRFFHFGKMDHRFVIRVLVRKSLLPNTDLSTILFSSLARILPDPQSSNQDQGNSRGGFRRNYNHIQETYRAYGGGYVSNRRNGRGASNGDGRGGIRYGQQQGYGGVHVAAYGVARGGQNRGNGRGVFPIRGYAHP